MSDLWLPLALIGTFATVVMVVLGVARVARAGQRRTADILQTQVEPVPVSNLREHELVRPFAERAVKPVLTALAVFGRRLTPLDMRKRLAQKLLLAGSPKGWDADRLSAFKVAGLAAGVALGAYIGHAVALTGVTLLVMIVCTTAGGYFLPDMFVTRAAEDRQKSIRRALPDTMDLLTISVEAGLGFDAALAQVVEHVPGPLSEEIARTLQEIQLGKSRVEAFRSLGERSSVEELNSFVLSIVQADVFGISVSNVLRSQAKELRLRRKQRAEREAMKIPVKIVFPTLLCVMPALFVVVLGPGVIRIVQNFSGFGR